MLRCYTFVYEPQDTTTARNTTRTPDYTPRHFYSLHQHTTTTYRRDLRPNHHRSGTTTPLQHYGCLKKAMYGLRTSPKLWQLHLGEVLRQQIIRQCKAYRCLWTTAGLGVLIYVDDLLLVGETTKIQQFISTLKATFTLKHVTTFRQSPKMYAFWGRDNSISISLESSYWENMLRPYHLDGDNAKTVTTTCLEQQPLQERERSWTPSKTRCSELQ